MAARSNIKINVTLGEMYLLQKLGELQDAEGAGTPSHKLRKHTGLTREVVRNALGRVRAALGEGVLELGHEGELRAAPAGRNIGRSAFILGSLIELAKLPTTDQKKLAQFITSPRNEIERRKEGKFDIEM